MRRVESLDGVRGIAIILVLLQHLGWNFLSGVPALLRGLATGVVNSGWTGVDVFFVLSGFLITSSLVQTKHREDFWRVFYLKRFFRIVPLFACLCLPIALRLAWHGTVPLYQALLVVTPFANYASPNTPFLGHLWSLAIEEQFYFFWPFVVRNLPVRKARMTAIIIALGSLLLFLVGWRNGTPPVLLYGHTGSRLFGIALGSALATLGQPGDTGKDRYLSTRSLVVSGLLALCIGLIASRSVYHVVGLNWLVPGCVFAGMIGAGLLTAGTISAAARRSLAPWAERTLSIPVLRWFGKRSYGIYLLHVVLIEVAEHLGSGTGKATKALAVLAVTLALAELSWRCLEHPMLRIGKRLTHESRTFVSV